jgi:hypothetical protein
MQIDHPYIPEVTPGAPLHSHVKSIVIVIILVVLLAIVGFLFWNQTSTPQPQLDDSMRPDSQVEDLSSQSLSDDLPSIEADLNATTFENVDAGSEEIR